MPTLSTKGQIVIPSDVRRRHGWKPGQRLDLVDDGAAVILRASAAEPVFPVTTRDDVLAVLKYDGPRVPLIQLGIEGIEPDGEAQP